MNCSEVDTFAELSLDGELDPSDQMALERHLDGCERCRCRARQMARSHGRIREHLQRSSEQCRPLGLETRVTARIRAESRRRPGRLTRSLPVTVGLAALALASLSATTSNASFDPEGSIARHAAQLPPEVRALGETSPVERFLARNFGSIPLPRMQEHLPHLQLIGARLDHVNDERAALIMFDHRGARVSMLVQPAKPGTLAAPAGFEVEEVHGHVVLVGRHRGYNMVAFERGPHLYSVVSDLDREDLVRLASAF